MKRTRSATRPPTVAEALADAFRARGVGRVFGVPGGGSSLDVIDAVEALGIPFVLAGTETAAAIMAAVTAELSGAPGVVITGLGPGAASAVNGIAYAALERAPVLLITDRHDDEPGVHALHQSLDQAAIYAPLVKAHRKLRAADGGAAIDALLDAALAAPQGPVHVDLSARDAAEPVGNAHPVPPPAANRPTAPGEDEVSAARALLARSERPMIIAGLYAREDGAARALGTLARALDCPVLATYKAKGVFPEDDPRAVGLFTGAAAEAECVGRADLILFYGLDPVEPIPHRWRFAAPILDLSTVPGLPHPAPPAAALVGPLAESAARLSDPDRRSGWSRDETAALRAGLRGRLAMVGAGGRTAQDVVEAVRRAAPGVRATVDSGAHMFSAMAFWEARKPHDVLKSNGLSTMAFALPAAIAAALHEPDRPVAALTGDGGLMMCLAELATAARLALPVTVVVFNDAALSLIDIKQQRQGRASHGVRYPAIDLAGAARALGCRAWRVDAGSPMEPVLTEALAGDGPALVDVAVDPAAYAAQLESLRG